MKPQMVIATMLVLVPVSAALAAQTSGTITAISKNSDTITLSDGKTYSLPEGIEDTKLRVGEKIQLTTRTRAVRQSSHIWSRRSEECSGRRQYRSLLTRTSGNRPFGPGTMSSPPLILG